MPKKSRHYSQHTPVLLDEVLQYLAPRSGETYLDLTAGYGGHAAEVLECTQNPGGSVLVDRDSNAVAELTTQFASRGVAIWHQDFLAASRELVAAGRQFDVILADLGVSSPHLTNASRGFAFSLEGPLDMRMDQSQKLSAATIVNEYDEAALAKIIKDYGEDPKAQQIARAVVQHRPVGTTSELADIVRHVWPGHSRVHPATRTFQAIRIAVNDELGLLAQSLPLWFQLLKPGGRLGVISFHSIEDRYVKRAMADVAGDRYDAELRLVTKRPVTAGPQELVFNPRSRSAKLRVAAKINI